METNNRIKISSVVESQLPLFVREEYPLVSELLTEYYRSLETAGSAYDILQNIDQYVKVNNLTNLVKTTTLVSDIGYVDTTINVDSTEGFPKTYGLIQVNNEIILYKSKTNDSFIDCVRGFSGNTEYSVGNTEELKFSTSEIQEHPIGSEIKNLSSLFLTEFFIKAKKQFLYGFENRELYSGINQNLFLKQAKDFYASKGTDRSFEILFRVLYGKDVEVILPRNFLIEPSSAQYRVTRNFVVEPIQGNLELLINKTIFQDQYQNIPKSFGTVTDIQRQIKNNKEYYTLFLDYDFDKDVIVSGSIFGDLKIHPKTIISHDTDINSSHIVVDSTIGFPESGELIVSGEAGDIIIQYEEKTINQFLGCTGITENLLPGTEISLNTYAYGFDSLGNQIKFRITGVIEEAVIPADSKYYEKGDVAKILTLGRNKDNVKDNNWIFNKTVKCEVKSLTFDGEFKYTVETYDNNGISSKDLVEVDYIDSSTKKRNISVFLAEVSVGNIPGKTFQISTPGIKISKIFYIKRKISLFSNQFVSDVLNVYKDDNLDNLYVASSSLPFYGESSDVVEDYKINLNGFFSGQVLDLKEPHGFVTGEAVVYTPESNTNTLGIQSGVYYIKKESETEIKLARSRSDIRYGKFVSIASTSVSNNSINLLEFSDKNKKQRKVGTQKLVKLIKSPESTGQKYETIHGTTGILINGVEILNYKSDDYLYYGAIKTVDVTSQGNNYDVINPPVLEISPALSGLSSAQGFCGVEGSIQRIDLIDGGFDYLDVPIITITGGGGQGATATAKMVDYDYFVDFNSSSTNKEISLDTNQIGFATYHKFRNGEQIIYNTGNGIPISGLLNGAIYYVNVIDSTHIRLHKTLDDSLVGINTINVTSYGVGDHRFESFRKKRKISSIIVNNSGFGYKSAKILVPSSGINTSIDSITAQGNQYNSGDVIYYYGGDVNISGLEVGKYIVTKINDNSFKLSNIGIGSTSFDFYFKTKQYIDFKSQGSGSHIFDYEPISVKISGKIGISTELNGDVSAKVQPIVRGKITSVFIYDGGVGYGSSEILNYNEQPNYKIKSGFGASITPIVSNGKIVNVIINEKGKDYNSIPDLIVRGFGVGAVLSPIIQNGQIVDVKIINSGSNYEQKNTIIDVISPQTGCELKFNPQVWTLNRFEKIEKGSKILEVNDSIVYSRKNKEYGLQYTHLYSPRSLRKKVFAKSVEENEQYKSDYQNDFDVEKYHSPLLGWAYDGNPIYGPYGYDSPTNKKVRQIISGYSEPTDTSPNRPDKKIFPKGYFVEDYKFANIGDLDEHNGRFCVTPEFPNGTYAYFMTLETEFSNSGSFSGDKKPKFPYIIGNSYKSRPIDFNFNVNNNQNKFSFNENNIIRNTHPYNTLSETSEYEFFTKTKDLEFQDLSITNTNKGEIDSIQIISGGKNYKIDDRLIFENVGSGGTGVAAKVEYIKGKVITGISQTTTKLIDVEFYPSLGQNKIIGFSSSPHNLSNGDLIFVNSLSNYDENLEGAFHIEVPQNKFILVTDVADASVTGLTTYFYVSGILQYPNIRENDILTINSEKVKILNIEPNNSRIRVLREQESTISTSHSAYTILTENPRKFYLNPATDIKNQNYKFRRELYFNPKESLGIGTYVGFGHTIVFSDPGAGIASIIIPEKSIYLKDHGFQTGDKVKYRVNVGTGISVSIDGNEIFELADNSDIFISKLSKDLIGISTVKVGLGSTGTFVGISQTASTLFFVDFGSGDHHSLQDSFDSISKGNIIKNTVTVSTASTHSLQKNDIINLRVISGITTTIVIKYNDYNRRLVVNPRNFSSVDIENNTITIENHKYTNGQKLIHTSTSPAGGLENEQIYYAIVYDKDRIKLAKSHYDSISKNQNSIGITSSSFGTLSPINPKLNITKNQKVIIDLSDSSLAQPFGIGKTSAFDFDLFSDSNLTSKYFPIYQNGTSKISKFGVIGVSSSARVEFTIDDDFPNVIWYDIIPRNDLDLISTKREYSLDSEVIAHNQITLTESVLNGAKQIVGISSNSFDFHNNIDYDSNLYSQSNATFEYYTNSKNETGEIKSIKIVSGGSRYERLPFISSISSSTGSGAILLPSSKSIGKINATNIINIGYNYSIDNTIRPTIKYPTIIRVEPLSTIETVETISPGLNYNTSPKLILLDGFTNEIVNDLTLDYDLELSEVKIIKNTKGLYNVEPKIIAVNNSNGVGISSIQYNFSTKKVRVYLNQQFSGINDFPFYVGGNVLIEGISTLESTSKGYNSKNYNYSLFPIVAIDGKFGGSGAYVEYTLENKLSGNEVPGTYDILNSFGQIVPENFLPTFRVKLSKNSFIVGEKITSDDGKIGNVLKFDQKNEYVTLETKDNFHINSLLLGNASKSQAFIREIFDYEGFYTINSSSIVKNGWNDQTGFLNDDLQRMHDNDYYQYFSYSLKSEVSIEEWNNVVSNLNHTLGFKKFGDLVLNSSSNDSGISTSQNSGFFSAICDLNSVVDIECIQDYDLASENNFNIDGVLSSNEIKFGSVILQDSSISIGNRVLEIDDISQDFNTSISRTFVTSFSI